MFITIYVNRALFNSLIHSVKRWFSWQSKIKMLIPWQCTLLINWHRALLISWECTLLISWECTLLVPWQYTVLISCECTLLIFILQITSHFIIIWRAQLKKNYCSVGAKAEDTKDKSTKTKADTSGKTPAPSGLRFYFFYYSRHWINLLYCHTLD